MCERCCGAVGPVFGMRCVDAKGHPGEHWTSFRNVDENGELTEERIIVEWDRELHPEAAWN